MKFSDIPGHEQAKERLRTLADSERIPHAILLEGPEGIGKHALARAFLQYVGCSDRRNGDSCGECPSCRQHAALQHIDTVYTFPYVKKSKSSSPTYSSDYWKEFSELMRENPFMDSALWLEKLGSPNTRPVIYVEEANELIRRLSFSSHSSRYNAVVMWQADKLNNDAANKLLKIIEEPPGDTIIVMTSHNPMNILPTIYSRTQRIKVLRHPDEVVARWMAENCGVDERTAAEMAPLASGSMLEAERILSKNGDNAKFLEQFISLMRLSYMRDIAALRTWSQNIGAWKRDQLVDFLEYMARMIRENFIANLHSPELNRMLPEESSFSKNFARFINERNVETLENEVTQAITDIKANVNPKIVMFDLAITVILKLKQ